MSHNKSQKDRHQIQRREPDTQDAPDTREGKTHTHTQGKSEKHTREEVKKHTKKENTQGEEGEKHTGEKHTRGGE